MNKCNYCGKDVKMVTGKTIYPNYQDLWGKFFYQCAPCDAYVGCHPGTSESMGTLANKALRQMRMKCHAEFDKLWKSGEMKRYEAYGWMQDVLHLLPHDAHIGKFNENQCMALLSQLERKLNKSTTAKGGNHGN